MRGLLRFAIPRVLEGADPDRSAVLAATGREVRGIRMMIEHKVLKP